jgi:Xaa-Pro aminopeptidase
MKQAVLIAGIPDANMTLFHRVRFLTGDPAAWLYVEDSEAKTSETYFVVRDIEVDRAKTSSSANVVYAPKELVDASKLSADREVGTAQAIAALLQRLNIGSLLVERSSPVSYLAVLQQLGIDCHVDLEWGATARRQKTPDELSALRAAQSVTENAMRRACETVANANVSDDGTLLHEGKTLTSEIMQRMIDVWLLDDGYVESTSIVAGGAQAADCHARGTGPLRSGEPVIIDIFPRSKQSMYWGDCTRTVVNGNVSSKVARMHETVVAAKKAAASIARAGVTGQEVNEATLSVVRAAGYGTSTFAEADVADQISMVHGTGHGVGLGLHEAPLLVVGGPPLLVGDVITIEPGLYDRTTGGVRVEDMYAITPEGNENFNTLHEGLDWRS